MIFNGFLNFAVLFRVSPVRVSSFRVSLWDAFQELLDTDANEPDKQTHRTNFRTRDHLKRISSVWKRTLKSKFTSSKVDVGHTHKKWAPAKTAEWICSSSYLQTHSRRERTQRAASAKRGTQKKITITLMCSNWIGSIEWESICLLLQRFHILFK